MSVKACYNCRSYKSVKAGKKTWDEYCVARDHTPLKVPAIVDGEPILLSATSFREIVKGGVNAYIHGSEARYQDAAGVVHECDLYTPKKEK